MNTLPTISIHAFGIVAEKLAASEIELSGVSDTDGILRWIREEHPSLNNVYIGIAVNRKMISENTPVTPESDIALLPPFSGG